MDHFVKSKVFLMTLLVLAMLMNPGACQSCNHMDLNNTSAVDAFSTAEAKFTGPRNGSGSLDGACGYQTAVQQAPFSSLVTGGSDSIFLNGLGCGACYQVKCTSNAACSGNPVTVTVTDSDLEQEPPVVFVLSGTAFGAMAKPGQVDQLFTVGSLQIQYSRVQCSYPGTPITFRVDSNSNPNYFAVVVEFVAGDGRLSAVDLLQSGSTSWSPMQRRQPQAVWFFSPGPVLRAPFSIRLTTDSGKTLVASNVIPQGWQPGAIYKSNINFTPSQYAAS